VLNAKITVVLNSSIRKDFLKFIALELIGVQGL